MGDEDGPGENTVQSLRTESEDTLEAQLVKQAEFDEEDEPEGLHHG